MRVRHENLLLILKKQPTMTRKEAIMSKPNPKPKTEETAENSTKELFADTNVTMKSGHLVKDAEIVGEGKYAKIRFASNKQYEVDGEIKTNTNYFDALISSNLTEAFDLAKSLKKGDWAYFKGEDSTRSFDTPEGYKKTASTIFAYYAVLKKEKSNQHPTNDNPTPSPTKPEAVPA